MRLNKPLKIIIGILTAFVVVVPFLYMGIWFLFIFSYMPMQNPGLINPNIYTSFYPAFFIPFLLLICSSFVQIGMQGFYIVHVVLNKSGSDVLRAVFGVGMFILAIIAMPVYYFIYILPENPPPWALAPAPGQASPVGTNPNPPSITVS